MVTHTFKTYHKTAGDFKLELGALTETLSDCQAEYSQLGIFLGLDSVEIKKFQKYDGNSAQCLSDLLGKYYKEKTPNMEDIYKAVKLLGYAKLSRELKEKYEGIATCKLTDIQGGAVRISILSLINATTL